MLQRAFEDEGEDLHVAVAMLAEAGPRGDAVLVEDPQHPEAIPARVAVLAEEEGMAGLEPAVVEGGALGAAADLEHRRCAQARCSRISQEYMSLSLSSSMPQER